MRSQASRDMRLNLRSLETWSLSEARQVLAQGRAMLEGKFGIPDDAWLERLQRKSGKIAEAALAPAAERLRRRTATRMLLTFPTTHFATLDLVDSKLLWGDRQVARFGSVGHPITPLKTMCRLDLEESPV